MIANTIAASLLLLAVTAAAQEAPRTITLDEAVALALKQNSVIRIAGLKVRENDAKARGVRANAFPQLKTEANLLGVIERQRIEIPRGALGVFQDLGVVVPPSPVILDQGGNGLFYTTTTVTQPLTQLIRIREGYRAANAETEISRAELDKARVEIAWHVHEIYYGLLIVERQMRAARMRVDSSSARLQDSETAVEAGNALEVAAIGGRAALLESRHALLVAEDQRAEFEMQLNDLLGLPLATHLALTPPPAFDPPAADLAALQNEALGRNPEVRAARQLVEKARHGIGAARADYIPELGIFMSHVYQNGVPFISRNNGLMGAKLEWNLFDFGKRRNAVEERRAVLAQAEENLKRLRNHTTIEVERNFRKLERARQMTLVAREALSLRRESHRLTSDQLEAGLVPAAAHVESAAALAKAEADALQADLGYRLAKAELDRAMGRAPQNER